MVIVSFQLKISFLDVIVIVIVIDNMETMWLIARFNIMYCIGY